MPTLDRAILIATQTHINAKDKGGKSYILHPLRVMFAMNNEDEMIVAVLHDVVEDSAWTIEKLIQEGFSEVIINALRHITKSSAEPYEEYILRVSQNSIACKVKMADMKDNMDVMRLEDLRAKDIDRLKKYHKYFKVLKKSLK